MSIAYLQLTPQDPIIARDGRPFGAGQGNRMRGLGWPLPSVVAGSCRTALVKASENLDFSDKTIKLDDLLKIEVAGVFPIHDGDIYLPAPSDALAEPVENGRSIKTVHRVVPQMKDGGCDFPGDLPLRPVMLPDEIEDFKPADIPSWWPISRYAEWLTSTEYQLPGSWFSNRFLNSGIKETREHVCLDAETGAAAEGQLFTTAGLHVAHLPKFYPNDLPSEQKPKSFAHRFADLTLTVRVTTPEPSLEHLGRVNTWHPLGGERRLVHWQRNDAAALWSCPEAVQTALEEATQIRMLLATPAIFDHGWRPDWLDAKTLTGKPISDGPTLRLCGVSNARWKAVSGWSLAHPRGPKPIRRMVPAGSVYFFEIVEGQGRALATNGWLRAVSDVPQDRRDGFGLALWGTW